MSSVQHHKNQSSVCVYQSSNNQSLAISTDNNSSMQCLSEGGEGHSKNGPMSEGSHPSQMCLICCDKATGKHYGAFSCDGCKGFFRRSVRKKNNYICQYNKTCRIDKDKRNQCRYCRLKKCIQSGMKQAAVQNERDRISTRRSDFDDISPNIVLSISQLMQVEQRLANQALSNPQQNLNRFADMTDVMESMKNQLFLLVNWAKTLPCFSQLGLTDQVALLKAHAGEILILGVIRRSFQLDENDVLLLGNNLLISRYSKLEIFAEIAGRILDDLLIPLRELQLDETEFTCLKAIIFFDPRVSKSAKEFIRQCRYEIQLGLMNSMNNKHYHRPGRFGELLLIISDLRFVTQLMVKKVEFMRMSGLAEIDNLLSEMLLGDEVINKISTTCTTMPSVNYSAEQQPQKRQAFNHFPSSSFVVQDHRTIDNLNMSSSSGNAPSHWNCHWNLPNITNEEGISHQHDLSDFNINMNDNSILVPTLFSRVGEANNLFSHSNLCQDQGSIFGLSRSQISFIKPRNIQP